MFKKEAYGKQSVYTKEEKKEHNQQTKFGPRKSEERIKLPSGCD